MAFPNENFPDPCKHLCFFKKKKERKKSGKTLDPDYKGLIIQLAVNVKVLPSVISSSFILAIPLGTEHLQGKERVEKIR